MSQIALMGDQNNLDLTFIRTHLIDLGHSVVNGNGNEEVSSADITVVFNGSTYTIYVPKDNDRIIINQKDHAGLSRGKQMEYLLEKIKGCLPTSQQVAVA